MWTMIPFTEEGTEAPRSYLSSNLPQGVGLVSAVARLDPGGLTMSTGPLWGQYSWDRGWARGLIQAKVR